MAQLKCIILISFFINASAFALAPADPAGKDDVVAPVVMKTEKADEVNVGAFSYTPDENGNTQTLAQLRAELLKMEKDLLTAGKKFNEENPNFNFVAMGATTAQMIDLIALENLSEAAKAKRIEVLNHKRKQSWENQHKIFLATKNADEKNKAEIAMMELGLDISFLREVVAARKSGLKLSNEALAAFVEALKSLSAPAKTVYFAALSDKTLKQMSKYNAEKYKVYLKALNQIDAFKALRHEEAQREMEEANRIKTNKEVFVSTTKRFAPETFAFFVATGAVTFNAMWLKSHGDPLQMERHIMSLKDPIAHISFYAFMQANGFFTNFHTSKASFQALDASTKRQMMVKLSYAGLAVGSLASSVVSDVGQTVVSCANQWIKGKKDDVSLESCEQAKKLWTVRKKTNQYFPQIIALFASQKVTELIEDGAFRAFQRMGAKSFAEKYLTRQALLSAAYRIRAADVVLTCIPYAGEAKWVSKGLKFVGTVTKLSAFVAVDHVLSSYVNRPISNILKPAFFDNKNVPNMNAAWLTADAINWDDAQSEKTSRTKTIDEKFSSNFIIIKGPHLGMPIIVPIKRPATPIKDSFPSDIESYTQEMQAWRDHLNESAEADLSGWEEMTKKLLNQIDFSYQVYRKFTNELFIMLNTKHDIAANGLDKSALSIISRYPLNRTLPFYGVSPGPLLPESASKFNDKYLSDPKEAQKLQAENILAVSKKYINLKLKFDNRHNETEIFNQILTKLNSNKMGPMVEGLVQLRKVFNQVGSSEAPTYSSPSMMAPAGGYSGPYYDSAFKVAVKKLFSEIGNPMPIMDPLASFSQAAASHTVLKGMDETADYSVWSLRKKYQFNKVTDLMVYKMVCGESSGSLNQVKVGGINFLVPEYSPPTLLKADADRGSFCKTMTNSQTLYYSKIKNDSMASYFLKNFNFQAIGDIQAKQDTDVFEKWWIKTAKMPMAHEFKGYDNLYKQVYEKAYDNFVGDGTWYENLVDHLNTSTEYLPNSIKDSLKTESSVYLQLINRALIMKDVKLRSANPEKSFKSGNVAKSILFGTVGIGSMIPKFGKSKKQEKTDYLLQANDKMNKAKFDTLYSFYRPEVANLYSLLNNYLTFVENYKRPVQKDEKAYRESQFNKYIENSKKIDTAINDILVSAGLKRLVKRASAQLTEEQQVLMAFAGFTEDSTETTEDIYEDLAVKNPTLRQKVIMSAVKGIRQIESETRRFIRMNTLLSNRLFVDDQEVLSQMGKN